MIDILIKLADHLDRIGYSDESETNQRYAIQKLAGKRTKQEVRGDCVFQSTHPKILDNKDHFPINSESQARNALARVNQFKEVPSWYDGSLSSLVSSVTRAVKKKYKDIEVSESSKRPGKG